MRLSRNRYTTEGLSGGGLGSLQTLTILALDHSQLTLLPESVGNLVNLKHLSVSRNSLQVNKQNNNGSTGGTLNPENLNPRP